MLTAAVSKAVSPQADITSKTHSTPVLSKWGVVLIARHRLLAMTQTYIHSRERVVAVMLRGLIVGDAR